MRHLAIAIVLLLFCTGCGTLGTVAPPPNSDLSHDPALPLFAADQAAIADADIARILDTRLELPETFRVGLVHLDHERLQDGRRRDPGDRSRWPQVTDAFPPLRDHERIYDVSYLPRLMLPAKLSASILRAAAARFQADWVLVFETGTTVLKKNKLLGTDRARAYCAVEEAMVQNVDALVRFLDHWRG